MYFAIRIVPAAVKGIVMKNTDVSHRESMSIPARGGAMMLATPMIVPCIPIQKPRFCGGKMVPMDIVSVVSKKAREMPNAMRMMQRDVKSAIIDCAAQSKVAADAERISIFLLEKRVRHFAAMGVSTAEHIPETVRASV